MGRAEEWGWGSTAPSWARLRGDALEAAAAALLGAGARAGAREQWSRRRRGPQLRVLGRLQLRSGWLGRGGGGAPGRWGAKAMNLWLFLLLLRDPLSASSSNAWMI